MLERSDALRVARSMIELHGKAAERRAAQRARILLADDVHEGARIWLQIAEAVRCLRATERFDTACDTP